MKSTTVLSILIWFFNKLTHSNLHVPCARAPRDANGGGEYIEFTIVRGVYVTGLVGAEVQARPRNEVETSD